MELISREDAIKCLDGNVLIIGQKEAEAVFKYFNMVIARLKSLPTIEERKEGRWIPRDWTDMECPERLRHYKCSICGKEPVKIITDGELVGGYGAEAIGARWEFKTEVFFSDYCPYCGAKMEGRNDEFNTERD